MCWTDSEVAQSSLEVAPALAVDLARPGARFTRVRVAEQPVCAPYSVCLHGAERTLHGCGHRPTALRPHTVNRRAGQGNADHGEDHPG
eukprot:6227006-Prymnesium_polylepis.10